MKELALGSNQWRKITKSSKRTSKRFSMKIPTFIVEIIDLMTRIFGMLLMGSTIVVAIVVILTINDAISGNVVYQFIF